ncbi:MAG: DinB family protein [Saprospiraceae bacterium]|nr:DinB family protein [Saprospiraceae bacterium]
MDILEQLETTKAQALEYFELSPDLYDLTYAEGKWTIRQLLHHIADAETVLYERIRRAIAEQPKPMVWAFDQDSWCRDLEYHSLPLEINKNIFSAVRTAIIHFTRLYYEQLGSNPFLHSETGDRTLKEEIDKVAWHSKHHLDQITQALAIGVR